MDAQSAAEQLRNAEPTRIAQLHPEIQEAESRIVDGVITITWPYSHVTNSIAFILAEQDFRLRSRRGQVRVEFHGATGRAISESGIGGGDEIRVSLKGATWEKLQAQTRLPGTALEWQLKFTSRMLLSVRRSEAQDPELIIVDAPEDEAPSCLELPPVESTMLVEELPRAETPPPPRSSLLSPPAKRLASSTFGPEEYASPAFVKRARVSYGALFEEGLDIFGEDEKNLAKRRKQPRFSMGGAGWRYSSRSPSPESEPHSELDETTQSQVDEVIPAREPPDTSVEPQSPNATRVGGRHNQHTALDLSMEARIPAEAKSGDTAEQPAAPRTSEVNVERPSDANPFSSLADPSPLPLSSDQSIGSFFHPPAPSAGHPIGSYEDANIDLGATGQVNGLHAAPADLFSTASSFHAISTAATGVGSLSSLDAPNSSFLFGQPERASHDLAFQHAELPSHEEGYSSHGHELPRYEIPFYDAPHTETTRWSSVAPGTIHTTSSHGAGDEQLHGSRQQFGQFAHADASSRHVEISAADTGVPTTHPASLGSRDMQADNRNALVDHDAEGEYEDGGDKSGDDYDLRNYAHTKDDDMEGEDESASAKGRGINIENENEDESDEEDVDSENVDDPDIHRRLRHREAEGEYSEEEEEEEEHDYLDEADDSESEESEGEEGDYRDGEVEYEQDEEEDEDEDDDEEHATAALAGPPKSNDPVFISLLSDSEDEEDDSRPIQRSPELTPGTSQLDGQLDRPADDYRDDDDAEAPARSGLDTIEEAEKEDLQDDERVLDAEDPREQLLGQVTQEMDVENTEVPVQNAGEAAVESRHDLHADHTGQPLSTELSEVVDSAMEALTTPGVEPDSSEANASGLMAAAVDLADGVAHTGLLSAQPTTVTISERMIQEEADGQSRVLTESLVVRGESLPGAEEENEEAVEEHEDVTAAQDVTMHGALPPPPAEEAEIAPTKEDHVAESELEEAQHPASENLAQASFEPPTTGEAQQLLTPQETQLDDKAGRQAPRGAEIIPEAGNDVEESTGPEEQIMAEFLEYSQDKSDHDEATARRQAEQDDVAKETHEETGEAEQRSELNESSQAAEQPQEPAVPVRSLRSRGHRKTESIESTDTARTDPSLLLAKASPATTRGARQKQPKPLPKPRNTRKKAGQADPSVTLAKASSPAARGTQRASTPEPHGHARKASHGSQLSQASDTVPETQLSPSVASSVAPEDERVSAVKIEILHSLRTDLPDYLSLANLRGSMSKTADFMAVSTTTPPQPYRPKNGPRDYVLELTLTDPSIAPTMVATAQLYRPHQASLPVVHAGDVVLLRGFQVLSLKGRGFGVRVCDASAWAVFEKGDEEMLPQIKGPPIERLSDEEVAYAEGLRRWWLLLDEKNMKRIHRATQKDIRKAQDESS